MGNRRQKSITRVEGSEQVMVLGTIDDLSDLRGISKESLRLITTDGDEIRLQAGIGVEGLEQLASKRVSMLGVLRDFEGISTLTVLGYRVMPPLEGRNSSLFGRGAGKEI